MFDEPKLKTGLKIMPAIRAGPNKQPLNYTSC